MPNRPSRLWVAADTRILSFSLHRDASDNESRSTTDCTSICAVKALTIYEFTADKARLQSVYRGSDAIWENGHITFNGEVTRLELADGTIKSYDLRDIRLPQNTNPFGETRNKPSHLNSWETREQMRVIE